MERPICTRVVLCWLALLPARVREDQTGRTWDRLRAEMERLQFNTYRGPAGEAQQCPTLGAVHQAILAALHLPPPPRLWSLQAPTTNSQA